MRHLNGVYTQSYNRRHRQLGHILQGRYKAIVIDKDSYLLEVCRYVVLNPMRAKAAERLEQWKWSSYNSTAGHGEAHGCLTTDWVLSHFSSRESQARKQYRDFVRDGIGAGSIYDDVKGQVFLGSEEFIGRIGKRVSKRGSLREVPRVQRYADRPELKRLFSGKQLRKEEQAKEAVERYGYSQKEIADFLGLHYSTISRWINMKSGGDANFKT